MPLRRLSKAAPAALASATGLLSAAVLASALLVASLLFAPMVLAPAPAIAQTQAPTVTRIAFGSCADEELPQPIWQAVYDYRPEVFLFAGDNVYGSVPRDQLSADLPTLRRAYEQALRQEPYQRIRRDAQVLAMWDDHDYGLNDGGADHPFKAQAKELFVDFWELPSDDPRRTRDGLYHAVTVGPEGRRVQIIMLDTRWFRSPLVRAPQGAETPFGPYIPNLDLSATVLGEAQWAWLAEQLAQPAEVRLILSSIQVLAEGHGWERWGNFPAERQRLFELIRSTRANGVVFLSGDRHIAGLYRETTGVPYPLTEITSSGINRIFPANREPGPNRLGAVYGVANFGTIDLDWWDGTVTLSVRGMNGEPVRVAALRLDQLRAPGG